MSGVSMYSTTWNSTLLVHLQINHVDKPKSIPKKSLLSKRDLEILSAHPTFAQNWKKNAATTQRYPHTEDLLRRERQSVGADSTQFKRKTRGRHLRQQGKALNS